MDYRRKMVIGRIKKMYCKSCGHEVSEDANYCPSCGMQIRFPNKTIELDEIIIRLKNGDKTAFDELYMRTQSYVRYIANQFFINENEKTEDVVQEVYLTIFRKVDTLNDPAAAWGWIKTITRNTSLNYLEKDKRFVLLNEDEGFLIEQLESTDLHGIPEAVVDEAAQKEVLGSLIDELPVLQKMILMEHYYNDKKISEIAEAYELVEGTVKSYLSRGRKALAEKLMAYQKRTGVCVYSVPSASVLYLVFRDEIQNTVITKKVPLKLSELLLIDGVQNASEVVGVDGLINNSLSEAGDFGSKAKNVFEKAFLWKNTATKAVFGVGAAAAIATSVALVDSNDIKAQTEIIDLVERFEDACQELNQEKALECMSAVSENVLTHINLMKEYVGEVQLSIQDERQFDLQIQDVDVDGDWAKAHCRYVKKDPEGNEEVQEGYLGFVHEKDEWKIELCRASQKMYRSGTQGKNVRFPELIYYELVYNDELEK